MSQFTEDEAQRIFARAAERQHAAGDLPPGFSLDELTEIGQAAGLAPEHIAAAVAEVRRGVTVRPEPRTFLGTDVEPYAERVLPGPLTDDLWGEMVERMRRTFHSVGVTSDVGQVREWNGTNASGGLSNLRMTARPVAGGTRVTLATSRATEARQSWGGMGAFLGPAVLLMVLAAAQGDLANPGFWVLISLLIAAAVAFPVGYGMVFRRWSARRHEQFDALLDHFDLLARADRAATPDTSMTRPQLDLDALADAPEASEGATRARDRA